MANYGFTGKEISEKLESETIENGGLELVTMPIAHCDFGDVGKVEIGGYQSFIHYNKDRENKNKIDKQNKRNRTLKRQIKQKQVVACGEGLPSLETTFSTHAGEKRNGVK